MSESFTPPKQRLELEELLESLRVLIKNNIVGYIEIESYISSKHIYLDQSNTALSEIWLTSLKQKVHCTRIEDLKFYLVYDYNHLADKSLGETIAYYLFYLTAKRVHPEFIAFLHEINENRILTLVQDKLIDLT